MKIAPLIHSRTLYRDYNSNFAVRPQNLNVQWAREKILASTKELGTLKDIRHVVASKDGIGIAGVSCIFKFFVEKYLPDKVKDAEKYFCDERGREVKIFLGYVFEMSGKKEIPAVSDEDLLQMFMDTLAPIWDKKFVETVYSNYKEYDTKFFSGVKNSFVNINGVEIYRENVFEQFLADAQVKNLSYCSNVTQFDIWEDGKFSAISTSDTSVINGLKSATTQKKTLPEQSQPIPSQTTPQRQFSANQISAETKSNSSILKIFAIALIVIIAIVFLLTK